MEEFRTDAECPHCGNEQSVTATFNFMEANPHGCKSHLLKEECYNCYKEFYFETYVSFDVDEATTYKKKPKAKP